ncbi:2-phosphosulfolactate phosphatase [bacterium]|nr:MAG: 2-phosphosulfolactate phosphatase [bacterium]
MLHLRYRALPDSSPAEVVVVIDVLRASTTALAALESGVPSVHAVAEIEEAFRMGSRGMLVAGEREGVRVDGFDYGNSPLEIVAAGRAGRPLVLCSTNGSRAMLAHGGAAVFIGCIRNAAATASAVFDAASTGDAVLLQGSGQDGMPTEEDAIAAGAIGAALAAAGAVLSLDAEARSAVAAWTRASDAPSDALLSTPHGRYLASLGLAGDVRYASVLDASRNAVRAHDGVLTLAPRRARG